MVQELTPRQDVPQEPADNAEILSFQPPPDTREITSWPVNTDQRQQWADALKSFSRSDTASDFLPRITNRLTSDTCGSEGEGGAQTRLSPHEVKTFRDLVTKVLSRSGDNGETGPARTDRLPGDKAVRTPSGRPRALSADARSGSDAAQPKTEKKQEDPFKSERAAFSDVETGAVRAFTVDYPGGKKSRSFKLDDKGNLVEFTQKDQRGEKTFFKDKDGKWLCRDEDGIEVEVKGEFKLDGKDFLYIKPGGYIRTEKSDGSVVNERQLEDGSRLALDSTGKNAMQLVRPDGSRVEVTRDKGEITKVVERDKDGKTVTWTKGENGVFTSDTQPPQERKDIKLGLQGKYTYEDDKGFTHTITGAGSERIEPRVTKNADGTTTVEMQYPGGQFRTLTLDAKGNLVKFVEQDAEGKRTFVKGEDGKWSMKAGLRNIPIPGDFKLDKNGDFISTDKDTYDIQTPDGKIIHGKLNANGTRLRLDDNGNITQVNRKDGSTVDISWENGQKTKIVETDKSGNQTSWTKNREGLWVSDGKPPEQRKNIDITKEGLVIATDTRGLKHVTLGDGTKLTEGAGGSRFTFDAEGRITSVTYPPGSQWGKIQFQYDQAGNVNKWELFDKNGKLLETRTKQGDTDKWKVTDGNGREKGTWAGEVKVSPQGDFMQRDPKDRQNNVWSYVTPDFKAYHEKTNADGSKVRTFLDKSQVELDSDGRITRWYSEKSKTERRFQYTSGELTKITDVTPKGTTEFNPKEHKNVAVDPRTGDYVYEKNDGSVVVAKTNGSKVEMDKDGNLTKVTTAKGHTRTFEYKEVDGRKELSAIVDTRQVGDKVKEERWDAQKNSDGSLRLTKTGSDGKQTVRDHAEIGRDGSYQYKTTDGRVQIARVERTGDGAMSENVEEARDRLREALEGHLDEARRARLEAHLRQFEKRAQDRIEAQVAGGMSQEQAQQEWEQKVAKTYDHLSNMLRADAPGAVYDLNTRVKLVEIMAGQVARPTEFHDQGYHGCCWMISGVNLGVTQHPEKMARMLEQIATTGKFTDTNGKTWDIPKQLLAFDREAQRWTISRSLGDGSWNPVSQILTATAAYLSENGRRMDKGSGGGSPQGCMHAMKLITGDRWSVISPGEVTSARHKQELLMKGGVIFIVPGHMYCGKLEKVNGQWSLVSDNQHSARSDHIVATIGDLKSWNVQRTGRSQYRTDANVPQASDQPVGPTNLPNGPDRRRYPHYWYPRYYPNYWDSPDDTGSPAPRSYDTPGVDGGDGQGVQPAGGEVTAPLPQRMRPFIRRRLRR